MKAPYAKSLEASRKRASRKKKRKEKDEKSVSSMATYLAFQFPFRRTMTTNSGRDTARTRFFHNPTTKRTVGTTILPKRPDGRASNQM
jgi:hypothetical protein